ncbi:HNH endonuclease signature motif containing protein [Corynebacterium stationis]|uniref:HNH endonuclease signature motif containing protein n=1 Tax=Corynebacterium stationis TaxID=1705 RepID=UPI00076F9017|nr:HNH endonuclease signature motif containing protein [Corynebacterium stationis]AMJ43569.1 HNH endonuclease [Corynebacterium stationis]AQX72237.1 HNH endonuclease [Corynebacterium stationis]ASJ17719.1 HNH endonuclease [Corynebacterium stationis]HJG63885.1 HNH endonuclease [Corynebacterium stationis]
MNGYELFEAFDRGGVGILRDFYELSPYDVATEGHRLSTVQKYARLARVYFGSCDSQRVQQETVALAEERRLSIEFLEMVNKHAKKLKARGAAWKLRAELIAYEGSYEEVDEHGKKRVTEEGGDKAKQSGVRVGRAIDGMRTISITDTQRRITDLEKTLDAAIKGDDQPRSEALLEPFWGLVEGNGTELIKPEYRTVIALGLDQSAEVFSGTGSESVIGLSDGTTMTGAEIVNAAMEGALGGKLYVGLFHPTAGPVNLYEARFASDKLRTLAMAENLVCPWPDCNVPADRCQVHHIEAHKNGCHTKPSNLTMLCKYHNGVNDDGPRGKRGPRKPKRGKPSRGRMRRHRGKVRLHTPGGKLLDNTHDLSSMGAMDLI